MIRPIERLIGLVSLLLATGAAGRDPDALAALHTLLAPLRQAVVPVSASGSPAERCAGPSLTVAKHGLRDWLEQRLETIRPSPDFAEVAAGLRDELVAADLMRRTDDTPTIEIGGDLGPPPCSAGYVSGLDIEAIDGGELLLVTSGLDIFCGVDDSAYLYRHERGGWRRLWQTEQPIDPNRRYDPQSMDFVHISAPVDGNGDRLILTLGEATWCTSNIRSVYYRLWRVRSDGTPSRPILDEAPTAFRTLPPMISGSLTEQEATIRFTAITSNTRDMIYLSERHYRIEGDRAVRIDPIADNREHFISEWLAAPWADSRNWTADGARLKAKLRHQQFGGSGTFAEFLGSAEACATAPDLGQVGFAFNRYDKSGQQHEIESAWFVVRAQAAGHYELVDIRGTPRPGCPVGTFEHP